MDCSGGSAKEVKECIIKDCVLYPFRLGKRPVRLIEGDVTKNNELSHSISANIGN